MQYKKQGFTLTELLVVIVVIATLASIVIPKYSKMLDTRKTNEAENMLSALRTEQEYFCQMGKKYISLDDSRVLPSKNTKNYTFSSLNEGQGVQAQAAVGAYTLQMPYYADGRICCSGTGCGELNKNYPSCTTAFTTALTKATECKP